MAIIFKDNGGDLLIDANQTNPYTNAIANADGVVDIVNGIQKNFTEVGRDSRDFGMKVAEFNAARASEGNDDLYRQMMLQKQTDLMNNTAAHQSKVLTGQQTADAATAAYRQAELDAKVIRDAESDKVIAAEIAAAKLKRDQTAFELKKAKDDEKILQDTLKYDAAFVEYSVDKLEPLTKSADPVIAKSAIKALKLKQDRAKNEMKKDIREYDRLNPAQEKVVTDYAKAHTSSKEGAEKFRNFAIELQQKQDTGLSSMFGRLGADIGKGVDFFKEWGSSKSTDISTDLEIAKERITDTMNNMEIGETVDLGDGKKLDKSSLRKIIKMIEKKEIARGDVGGVFQDLAKDEENKIQDIIDKIHKP